MKNRKVIVTAFLLVAVMILGVGYAAVVDTLHFNGDATLSQGQVQHEFDLDVMLTAVSEDGSNWIECTPSTVEINRADDLIVNIIDDTGDNVQDSASFQIYSLTDAQESQVIWFKVQNNSAHDATLSKSIITETGTADHFDSAYTLYEEDGTTETTVLPANGVALVKLVITLKTTPSGVYQASFSFAVTAEVADQVQNP